MSMPLVKGVRNVSMLSAITTHQLLCVSNIHGFYDTARL